MSTTFPTSVDSYTAKTNGVDTVQAAHINNLQDAVVAIETVLSPTVVAATASAAANALTKRDSTGSIKTAGWNGTTAAQSVDVSSDSGFSMANNAQLNINVVGLLLVYQGNTGSCALFFIGGGGLSVLVAQTSTDFSATLGTANKVNVGYSAPNWKIENKTGASVALRAMSMKVA